MTNEDALFANVKWVEMDTHSELEVFDGLPVATHEGILDIGGCQFRCYQLNNGRRVIDSRDVAAFFGFRANEKSNS